MKQKLQSILFALIAIMMPIGASAEVVRNYVDITIGGSGVATLYYSSSSLIIPEDVTASIITGIEMNNDGTVTVVKEDLEGLIPAGCAVILRGDAYTYTFHETVEEASAPESNLLLGSDGNAPFCPPDSDKEYLCFTLDSENEENSASLKDWIYVGNEGFNEAHKAYLALPVEDYPELAETLGALENPHLQHTHGGCEICGQETEAPEVSWGSSADALTSYGTLEDAIYNAGEEDSNIGYIKLLADVEVEIYVQGGNFTLDLNGHTISSELHTLVIQNNSNVTIVDNSETKSGKVISSGDGCFAVCVDDGASVTIQEGTYESTNHYALYLEENSSVTINGGSYESPYRPVFIGEGCSATITGGTFTSTNSYAITNNGTLDIEGGTFISEVHYTLDTNGKLIIKGGEFSAGENFAVLEYSGGMIDLSEFDQDITAISVRNTSGNDIVPGEETILLPEGYCFYKGEKNVTELVYTESYTIGEAPTIEDAEAVWYESEEAEAPLGFGSLSDAVAAAAEEGSTVGYIQLLEDVNNDIYVEGGNFTLDLNGYTISSESHTLYIQNNSNVTIVDNSETKSGKVISSGESSFAVGIINGASVTIEEGTYESTNHYALYLEVNSSATINGGSYESPYRPVFIGEGCSATITGGTFKYTGDSAIENYGNLVVEGGTFTYDGDVDPDSYYTTINHFGGSIDLSNYPIDAINSIGVTNYSGEDITPGAETILLPEGYCFFDYSDDTPVTVLVNGGFYYIGEEPETKYTITFAAGDGGEGEMADGISYGYYLLPECTFAAPEGKKFDAWQVGDDEENLYQPGEEITVTADTEIKAVWTLAEAKWGTSADAETFTYGTLAEAFEAAYTYDDETGELIPTDVSYIKLQSNVNSESSYVIAGGEFTLDLNGKTLQSNSHTLDFRTCEVTITDGSDDKTGGVVTTDEGCFAVRVDGGKVTIADGRYEAACQAAVCVISGEAAINGGTFESTGEEGYCLLEVGDAESSLTINGGTFNASNAEYTLSVLNGGTATVKGGSFEGAVNYDVEYHGGTLIIGTAEGSENTPGFDPAGFSVTMRTAEAADINIPEDCFFFDNDCDVTATADFKENCVYTIADKTKGTFAIADDTDETPFEVTKPCMVNALTYTRTLPNLTWNALFVPFEIPVSQLTDKYDVAYINDVHSYDTNEDGTIDNMEMELIKIKSGTLKGNYPYLIRAKNEGSRQLEITVNNTPLYSTKESLCNSVYCSSAFTEFYICGTYEQMNKAALTEICESYDYGETRNGLVVTGDGWKSMAENAVLNPFRLYMVMITSNDSPVKVEQQALSRVRIRVQGEGGETGIEEVETSGGVLQPVVIHDLMGRPVARPQKGSIYVVNGKKVMWK